MQITVVPSRQVIKASQGETLLDACRRAGEPISYSCLEGQCGLCRCYLATPDFAGGMLGRDALPKMRECLACQTPLQSGGLVEIPDANDPVVLPAQSSKGRVEALEPLLADVTRATVVLDKPLQYLGGQHFEIAFGPKVKRYYSPNAASDSTKLVFDIQLHPYGGVSQHVRNALAVGDAVRVRGPLGRSYLRRKDASKILLVSSGTGLGAMTSLMRDIKVAKMENPVHVFAGFSFAERVYGREELRKWASGIPSLCKSQVVVASGVLNKGDQRGLLTDAITSDLGSLHSFTAYLFGNPSAVEATSRRLLDKGVSSRQLHCVAYQTYDSAQPLIQRGD